ncbi:MAG: response regulator [Dehalococcoidia bacterium]|nr:response regulator [Dehalococcoidia bacterium]
MDIGLPDINGFEVCERIRHFSDVPVVMLTARHEEVDKVKGLEIGADDYVTKPSSHIELLARVRAVLRRRWERRPIQFSRADLRGVLPSARHRLRRNARIRTGTGRRAPTPTADGRADLGGGQTAAGRAFLRGTPCTVTHRARPDGHAVV